MKKHIVKPYIEIKKLVDKCRKCNKELPLYNRHHFLCKKCWEEEQWNKGNIALLGGVK